jgi:hypothetical protein
MDGFILLIILIPLVFLILLLTILNRSAEQRRLLESLYDKIKQLSNDVSALTRELKNNKEEKSVKPVIKESRAGAFMTEKPEIKIPEPVESKNEIPIIPEPVKI